METAPTDTNNGLLFANFNQDFGCFVSVTDRGFRIFNADPLREKEARHFPPGKKEEEFSKEEASSLGGVPEMTVTADATLDAVGKGLARIVKVKKMSHYIKSAVYIFFPTVSIFMYDVHISCFRLRCYFVVTMWHW